MENKKLICIGCPLGCILEVEIKGGEMFKVSGNTCQRGADYAVKELTNPTRILTTTVRVKGGRLPVVSVKSSQAIPKDKIATAMKELQEAEVMAPIGIGDRIKENIAGTGVDIVATKEIIPDTLRRPMDK